jgi:outer membrane protein OmpA-like peptidoglycan-associated protein
VPQIGFVSVLEKQAMQSSLGFLDATAMKKELDAKGRVALYINFDLDKATLRPDAQPIIDEIQKLLAADAALKLSIEGHTDSTGSADHNRTLATSRARAVLGALVGLGVDASRLSSQGFGPDKPIADNATDAGRAKNRRVELVKTN